MRVLCDRGLHELANAAGFYRFSQVGDVINVASYVRPPELDQDGTDCAWRWDKDKWVAGDAVFSQHHTSTSTPRVTARTEGP